MSDNQTHSGTDAFDDVSEAYATAFNRDPDPLEQYSDQFKNLPDPFEFFIQKSLKNRDSIGDPDTYEHYHRTYREWKDYIRTTTDDRHPACPSTAHVKRYIEWRRDVHQNSRRTILGKLSRLAQAYEYWQSKQIMPHPKGWNPFEIAREEVSLGEDETRNYPDLPLSTLQSEFAKINNIRSRAIIGTQLKEGLRAGEVGNLRLSEVHISHHELQGQYPELGTHHALSGHSDVVYVPHDRDGNKSTNPRLLPIDDELRWLLIRHLLTRPQVDEPWVFLSRRSFGKIGPKPVNRVWKEEFHPKYAETAEHDAITSHFGRHWFSTYWRLEAGLEREHVQYMRGDLIQPYEKYPDPIDDYLHPNYRQIESVYRENVFKLNIALSHSP
ncbi:tyrosine-type recombinase/integrase [Halorubrum vacuolatum]|uniref:Integrase/recombinase XerD n=1 Tax=Halorubrum vacuolatum TaxID=63740 RepID=A0A238Y1E4_HALVU|nr:site-specific integrase [Halorubrum vacuolatum]SNR64800.1 integrase/recombinase XerD [Halorubrum vacuolatum]